MKNILLVDDEKDFCFFVKSNLELTNNFKVTVCLDSNEAIDLARKLHPDLILLDILMPGISGPDIAAALEADKKTEDIPIVFLTAIITEKETKEQNVIAGWPFVAKPVKIKELIDRINEYVR